MIQETLTPTQRVRRSHKLDHPHCPFWVDEWEPRNPSAAAPILLIHGWGGTGTYWRETAHFLSKTARVFVPDLPGTGRSQPISTTHDMAAQVDALVYLLDQFEVDRVQVVGHSMGGAMALLLNERVAQRIERSVLTSVCFFTDQRQQEIYRNVMKVYGVTMAFRPEWLADVAALRYVAATRFFHRVPKDKKQLLRQGLLDYLQLDKETAMACATDAADPAIPLAGSRVQSPVLLVACRQDQVMPTENVNHTQQIIPDCEVVWIEECGHMPMVEKSAEYHHILANFLTL